MPFHEKILNLLEIYEFSIRMPLDLMEIWKNFSKYAIDFAFRFCLQNDFAGSNLAHEDQLFRENGKWKTKFLENQYGKMAKKLPMGVKMKNVRYIQTKFHVKITTDNGEKAPFGCGNYQIIS